MAFFDELGKKISQTSQDVVQKTKDTAEIMRLNGLISDDEKRIESLYTELGKAYFSMHADSYEDVFQDTITAVKEAQARIAENAEQVKKLKGLTRCPNCNNEVPYTAPFCSSCGTKLQQESNVRRCPKCGGEVAPGFSFCSGCGSKVDG